MGKPYSRTNFLGNIEHYDENGKKTGESRPGFFEGTYVDYDAKGNKVGTSSEKMFGVGYNHYDNHGHKTGSSDEGMFGGYTHRDARGRVTGTSYRSSFDILPSGPNKKSGSIYAGNHEEDFEDLAGGGSGEGCYIATCVYGSYDCPEVMTLRRFRDEVLAKYVLGRGFIRVYYFLSPKMVKLFGRTKFFHVFWRGILDRFILHIREKIH
ncbi:MAG: hypothetical protein IJ061_00100 [Lachnospiraceae bacterium]|nr:hypothetical protein [Lachnospiraceae bacterium]